MSPETVAALVGGAAGGAIGGVLGIIGALVGVAWDRFLRSRGDVWCAAGPLRWTFRPQGPQDAYGRPRERTMAGLDPIGRGDVAQVDWVSYRVEADFYNGTDRPAALRSFEVLFHRQGDTPMRTVPEDGRTARTEKAGTASQGTRIDPLKVLNVPPRQFVALEVRGAVPDPARLEGCNRVELRAEHASGDPFSRDLARLDPSVALAG